MDFVEILEHHLLDHKIAKLFTIGHDDDLSHDP